MSFNVNCIYCTQTVFASVNVVGRTGRVKAVIYFMNLRPNGLSRFYAQGSGTIEGA